MANEISVTTGIQVSNGTLVFQPPTSLKQVNQSAAKVYVNTQAVGTTYEALAVPGDIATLGYARFVNLDATNYVEIGLEVSSAFYGFVKLKAGEPAVVRLASGVTYACKANTASVNLYYEIHSD